MGVATRGVKFKFTSGEKVLCYEPDPTKAKVLYESKVLDLVVSRDERGRKIAEYLIHFFGWNSSWDRCVREEFILPFTDENQELQLKLAEEAALTIKGKRKLPPLIKETLNKKHCNDIENEKAEGTESTDYSTEIDTSEIFCIQEEKVTPKEVFIDIPQPLKLRLEEDWINITERNKLVELPRNPNVVAILESFVKHYASKMLCASPPRNGKKIMPEEVQNKLRMYKEAVDGVRVYFDFTLPHLLLYNEEKRQYSCNAKTCTPASRLSQENMLNCLKVEPPNLDETSAELEAPQVKKETVAVKQERPQKGRPCKRNSPTKRNARTKSTVDVKPKAKLKPKLIVKRKRGRPKSGSVRILRSGRKPRGCPIAKPKQARRSLSKQRAHQEPPAKRLGEPLPKLEETSPKKLGESPKKLFKAPGDQPGPSSSEVGRVTRGRLSISRVPEKPFLGHQEYAPEMEEPIKLEKNIGHPERALPSHGGGGEPSSSNCKSSSEGGSSGGAAAANLQLLRNTSLLRNTLEWRMLPSELYGQMPAPPSLVYGSQHLLRLFVKLPSLVSKMNISSRKLHPLLVILEQILSYLCDRQEQFFPLSAYMDCTSK